jgi:hypothetical protein
MVVTMFRIMAALALGAATAFPVNAAPACRVTAPTAFWIGPCVKGLGHGLGVLRVARRNRIPLLFFGQMVRGRPFSDVLSTDTGDWHPAWRLDANLNPRPDPDGDRRYSAQVFNLAAAAAREASRRYQVAGNTASAKFYARQSEKLADALD